MSDLLAKLDDLLVQATQERSHYYVASCVREARAEIERLHNAAHSCAAVIGELEAEVERLKALLRPFVDMVAEPEDFAAARKALEEADKALRLDSPSMAAD